MESVASRSRYDVNQAAACTAGLCRIKRTQNVELANRVDAWVCLNRDVRATVGNVCAINTECVLRTARTVDRDVDGVCLTGWVSGAYIDLVSKVVRNSGSQRDELDPVSIVQRKFANLIATNYRRRLWRRKLD